jgi:hypothetical protein
MKAKIRRGFKKAQDAVPGAAPARIEKLVVHYLITEAQGAAAGYGKIIRA